MSKQSIIEDLIAVKLELSTNLLNHRLYGFDIWNRMSAITKEAVFKVFHSQSLKIKLMLLDF